MTGYATQLFSAARCFRSEFRREIFAFAASTCSALDGLFRACSAFEPSFPCRRRHQRQRGLDRCQAEAVGFASVRQMSDRGFAIPINAPGRNLFKRVAWGLARWLSLAPGQSCERLLRRLPHMPRRRRPHRHQLFGRGRMQRNGRVEIGFGRLHLHGDGDRLDDFGRGVADDVAAEHAVASCRRPRASSARGCRGRTSSP